jgi:hypothetical protein
MDYLSIALELEHEESLRQHHIESMHVLSIMHVSSNIHYPESAKQQGEAVRFLAHYNLSTLTHLFQRNIGDHDRIGVSWRRESPIFTDEIQREFPFLSRFGEPGLYVIDLGVRNEHARM